MIGPLWRWVTGADEPPEPPAPAARPVGDLKPAIRAALETDYPNTTLRALYPWVPARARAVFLIRARYAGSDAKEEQLVTRYEATVKGTR